MRLQEIILEQQNRDVAYDRMMTEANMKFWSTITKNAMLPLSESAQSNSMDKITAMLYETAWKLPDDKKDIFFEQLLNNPMLDEDVKDFLKNTGNKALNGVAATQGAVENAKKKVAGTVIKGVKAAGAFASDIYKNYVPLAAQQQIAKMGKAAIQKVQQGIQKLGNLASKVLAAINKVIAKYKNEDPCRTNESLEIFLQKINEAIEKQYFIGDKAKLLDTIVPELQKLEGGLPIKLAKTISMLKSSGISVYGRDARGIAYDITSENVGANFNDLSKIKDPGLNDNNPYFPMSKYFKDNNIKELIKEFDLGNASTGEGACEISEKDKRTLVEKYMGPDSQAGKALAAIGLQEVAAGMVEEIKKHPGSFLISVLSAIVTIVSGGTALRLAAVIFGSVLPAFGNAYVEYLKTNNAPQEKIDFAEKVVKAIRFIATIAQVINIASFIEKGWLALSANDIETPTLSGTEHVAGVLNPAHEMSDLSAKSQDILTDWTKADGSLELSPKTVHEFFNNSTKNMTPEQFKKFDDLIQAAKDDPAKYQELVKVLDNPTGNGIINVDMEHAGKIADATKTVAPNGLLDQTNITQAELLKATGISNDDFNKLLDNAKDDYVLKHLGGSAHLVRGIPLSDKEYAKAIALGYDKNQFSDSINEYLKQFQDRKDDITKAAFKSAAQKAGIQLPDNYTIEPEASIPTDLDAADDLRQTMGDLPNYDKYKVPGLDRDDIRKLYYAIGESEHKLAQITGMVSKGELDPSKVKNLVDNVSSSGQTQSEFIKSLTESMDINPIADITKAEYEQFGINAETSRYFKDTLGTENVHKVYDLVRQGKLNTNDIKQTLDLGMLAGQNKEQMMKAIEKLSISNTSSIY